MKQKIILIVAIASLSIFLPSSMALAAPSASLLYLEKDLGGGVYQYDYTFYNSSTAGEDLYEVILYFDTDRTATGAPLPTGWDGIPWEGTNTTSWLDTYSTDLSYDIAAGSSLSGFSFTVDYHAGDISYDAYLSGDNVVSGSTAIVPEPISSVLFIIGGATLGVRRLRKKVKK